jgi:cation transport ATPase
MKKAVVIFILAGLLLLSSLLWFIYSGSGLKINNILHFSVVILLVAFALFIGYKQAISAKRGEPGEDELSKKLLRRASSLSYYISIYLWLFIMYFSDKLHYETHVYFAAGILGMAVIFAGSWVYFSIRGIRNE